MIGKTYLGKMLLKIEKFSAKLLFLGKMEHFWELLANFERMPTYLDQRNTFNFYPFQAAGSNDVISLNFLN